MKAQRKKKLPTPKQCQVAYEQYEKAKLLSGVKLTRFLAEIRAKDPQIEVLIHEYLKGSTGGKFLETIVSKPVLTLANEKPKELKAGAQIGDFEIVRTLGKGSFATVYLARDKALQRDVAIKVSDARFPVEGQTLATLEHPNVVKVYSQSIRPKSRFHYLCMQYVPGLTLDELLRHASNSGDEVNGAKLLSLLEHSSEGLPTLSLEGFANREALQNLDPVDLMVQMGEQLAGALHYVHRRDIFHLDLKPANIIINKYGQPMMMDFNVSIKNLPENRSLENFGGTFTYMSPEQKAVFEAEDKVQALSQLDCRSDIFSLGVVLREFIEKVKGKNTIPRSVEKILAIASNPVREIRFKSAEDFRQALASYLDLRQLERRLPRSGFFLSRYHSHPYLSIWALGIFLNLIFVSLMPFKAWTIRPQLDASAYRMFILKYGACCFVLFLWGAGMWSWIVARLRRATSDAPNIPVDSNVARSRRKSVLGIANVSLTVSSLIWLPQIPICYSLLRSQSSDPGLFFHFSLSVVSTFGVATVYTYLLVLLVLLREIYPRVVVEEGKLSEIARAELGRIAFRVKASMAIVSLAPSLRYVLIMFRAPVTEVKKLTALIALTPLNVLAAIILGLTVLRVITELSRLRETSK